MAPLLLALGETFVIIAGGIDLSVGFIMGLSAVIAAVVVSRFAWIGGSDALVRLRRGRAAAPSFKSGLVMGWAGMRGVVTLAVALSLPAAMPGRDVILMSAFAVIFATVLGQGTTLGLLVRWLRIGTGEAEQGIMTHVEALAATVEAQRAAVVLAAHDEAGTVLHPRLLEQFSYRADLMRRIAADTTFNPALRDAHFGVLLAAVAAGRREIIRLHHAGRIGDDTLHAIEYDLDLQEISARRVLDMRPA